MSTDRLATESQRVGSIPALSSEQRVTLKSIAEQDPAAAEAALVRLLRTSRSDLNRRYVAEVLLGGADHDQWVAEHHKIQTEEEHITETLGRKLTAEETHRVPTIADLQPTQVALAIQIRAQHGPMAAKTYLRFVLARWRVDILMNYADYVLARKLTHAQWVERKLPDFKGLPDCGH